MQIGKWGVRALLLGLFLAFLASGAAGEEQASSAAQEEVKAGVDKDSTEKLPPIEVSAPMEPGPTGSVITRQQMELGPAQNLPGYLDEQSGIDLTRRSLLGEKRNQAVIRGFDESRCQVYLNGRSIKGVGVYGGYYVDWSTLSLAGIDRLEIIRGAQ